MTQNSRINIIDEVRGALIILVAVYHLFYDLVKVFGVKAVSGAFSVMNFIQPALPFLFILISGVSFSLSRSNIRRGLVLGAIALIMTLILWIFAPEYVVLFGILHFLALMKLCFGFFQSKIDRAGKTAGIIICCVCAALFLVTYNVQLGYVGIKGLFSIHLPDFLYESDALMVLGFHTPDFVSSDYIPLLPWVFVFVIGIIPGGFVQKLPEALKKPHIPPLAFIGRHTLIIYLVHQPLFFGVLRLIFRR